MVIIPIYLPYSLTGGMEMSKYIILKHIKSKYTPISKVKRPDLLEEARRRLTAAQSVFNEAIENKDVDEAIYALAEAENFYHKILQQSKPKS
jgi:hypothetical protein